MSKILFAALLSLSFTFCSADPGSSTTTSTATTVRDYTVRLYDAGYGSAGIRYYTGAAWSVSLVPMTKDGAWWKYTFTCTNDTAFYFKLDGTTWYPALLPAYRASTDTLYVRDGILYPYDPTGPAPSDEIAVLTLNLHTYQESDAVTKLGYVAELMDKANIDFAAFVECAQNSSSTVVTNVGGVNVRSDNMARIIVSNLAATYHKRYHYYWNWSHYGFTVYEEGSAVIARTNFAFLGYERKYISTSTSTSDINSRTALFGRFAHPLLGQFNLFATHVSWGDVQDAQLRTLKTYALSKTNASTGATLVCGDFNMNYNSAGYVTMTSDGVFFDAYKTVNPRGAADATMSDGTRIDYQFPTASGKLVPIMAQRVFLQVSGFDDTFKQVSDHYGVIVRYRVE